MFYKLKIYDHALFIRRQYHFKIVRKIIFFKNLDLIYFVIIFYVYLEWFFRRKIILIYCLLTFIPQKKSCDRKVLNFFITAQDP